jgi:exodeoxyribonuclease VII large subunit
VQVQGEDAARQVAAAIRGFSALVLGGPVPRPDVLIVARGGGALEDLMPFNEEIVVRAAAECTIPLISAVGHETDTTLIDFASDQRAPTPTAAAELAVPSRSEIAAELEQFGARLVQNMRGRLREGRLHFTRAERGLPDLPGILDALRQRLDDRGARLEGALPAVLVQKRGQITRWSAALRHPREVIADSRAGLAVLGQRLAAGLARGQQARAGAPALARLSPAPLQARLREDRLRFDGLVARLEAGSIQAVLARGFALVQGQDGKPVTGTAQVKPGQRLRLTFGDGIADVRAEPTQGTLL